MIISITTVRELVDDSYEDYIKQLNSIGIKINAVDFKRTKEYTISDDFGHTKATTTYRIIDNISK
jgi:hypothetical protein